MAQDEATEYLLTELEERARSGVIDRMNATQFAALQYSILEDQIQASRRLGKTVDEIADIQKDVQGDDRITALINSFSGDETQNKMINELISNLSAVPGLSSADIADIIAAEQSGLGMETTEAYERLTASLSQTPGALEAYTQSIGDSVQALINDNQEGFEAAQASFAETTKLTGDAVQDIVARANAGDETARGQLIMLQQIAPELLGAAATMSRFGEVDAEQRAGEDDTAANQMVQTAKEFDNAVLGVTGAFTAEITRAQQEVNDTLGIMTQTITESGLVDGAKSLAETLGNMAVDGIKKANEGLATLAGDFVNFSTNLQQIYGEEGLGGVADYITQAAMDNIVMPLAKAVGSIFTNPEVIAAAVAGIGALMLAMRTAVAGMPGIGAGGAGVDALAGGDADGKDGKGKGGRGIGRGAKALVGGAGGFLLSGALEAMELSDDLTQIDQDLESGKIEEYEAKIAKTAETSEAVGGTAGAVGGAAAGAAVGSVVPLVGTAIGGLIGGAIGWYAGREGTRAVGEGLAEAVFTPEHIALENELAKIEERLTGDINNRTRRQLETRQKQVEAELELLTPVEQSQPVNPTNQPVMVTPPEETETDDTPGPVSQDGTPTQEVMSNQKSDEMTDISSLEDLILMQTQILNDIKKNTKATVSGIGDIASS